MKPVSRFAISAALVAAVLAASLVALNSLNLHTLPSVLYLVCLAFGILTTVLYAYISKSASRSASRFVTAFMASVTVKLLATAAFLGVYIYFFKVQKVPVALGTFVIYVVYTVLLIRFLRFDSSKESRKA